MSTLNLKDGDISPGSLWYMRSWTVESRQVRVGRFEVVDGQVWWLPDPNVAKQVTPRSFTVLVAKKPVPVKGKAEERLTKPARLILELAEDAGPVGPDSGPGSVRGSRRVEITFTDLVKSLSDGWESVDATVESP
jgi:hypothetical protein